MLNASLAEEGLKIARPLIQQFLSSGIPKRDHLAVIVLRAHQHGITEVQNDVLAHANFGDEKRWEHRYYAIALAKAQLSWRTGLPSSVVSLCYPQLLTNNDTFYWGSAVCIPGMVVAASGIEPCWDEFCATTAGAAIQAVCKREAERLRATGEDFVREAREKCSQFEQERRALGSTD